jgi:hypothetical protein
MFPATKPATGCTNASDFMCAAALWRAALRYYGRETRPFSLVNQDFAFFTFTRWAFLELEAR